MAELKFEITKNLAVLSQGSKSWTKEINLVSWNDRKPKIDIREWDEAHDKMGKGVTLSKEELKRLKIVIEKIDFDELDID